MPPLEVGRPRPDVAVITLNRPDKLNALDFGLVEDLHDALADINSDGACDIGVSYTLPRIVGAGQVFDLILTARTVEADEALRIGLVSRISADSVVDDALAIAETLCSYGMFGLESTKQVLWANLEAPSLHAALQVENRSQILSSTSGELKKATTAFAARKRD
jgi:enoyl-CoA hydratase/carnithine racemase